MGEHRVDFIEYNVGDSSVPRREIVAVDPVSGRSVLVRFPADWNIADALPDGYVVEADLMR